MNTIMLPIRRAVARIATSAAGPVHYHQASVALATRAFATTATRHQKPAAVNGTEIAEAAAAAAAAGHEPVSQATTTTTTTTTTSSDEPAQGPSDRDVLQAERKRSVFVVNVAVEATEDEVRQVFNEFAPVQGVTRGAGGAHWFVFFEDEQTATRIIEQTDGLFLRGRQMRVAPRLSTASGGRFQDNNRRTNRGNHLGQPSPTLFIGNMPYNMTDQDLNDFSKKLEYCFDMRVSVDRHTNWPRGYAHADFYTVGLAQRALKKLLEANTKMGPNTLRLDFAQGARGGSATFNLLRLRSLKKVNKTLEQYEKLTEELRKKEGGWDLPQ